MPHLIDSRYQFPSNTLGTANNEFGYNEHLAKTRFLCIKIIDCNYNKEASRLYAELLPSRADDMHTSRRCADDMRMTYVIC